MKATITQEIVEEVEIDAPIYDSTEIVRWLSWHRDHTIDPSAVKAIQYLIEEFLNDFRPFALPEGKRRPKRAIMPEWAEKIRDKKLKRKEKEDAQ